MLSEVWMILERGLVDRQSGRLSSDHALNFFRWLPE